MGTNGDGSGSTIRSADAVQRQPARVWWVNQGSTYEESWRRGLLVAPLHKRDGSPHQPYSDLERAEPGDMILHYASSAIRATSRVVAPAVVAPRPPQIPLYEAWKDPGYLLRAAYRELDQPIERDAIPLEWRTREAGPFNRYGEVRQAYFFALSRTFVDQLASAFPALELAQALHQKQCLMYQWKQAQWLGDEAAGKDGEPLAHAASNGEQFARLRPGDRLYVVGQWRDQMMLLGRMDVARLMRQDQAEEYFDGLDERIYEARYHVLAGACTPERFDRIVPEDSRNAAHESRSHRTLNTDCSLLHCSRDFG